MPIEQYTALNFNYFLNFAEAIVNFLWINLYFPFLHFTRQNHLKVSTRVTILQTPIIDTKKCFQKNLSLLACHFS